MKSKVVIGVVLGFLFVTAAFGTPVTQIIYETTDLGSDRWEYTYTVTNFSLTEAIEEFTIWFDYGLYDNLVVTTPESPPDWDQIVWDPEPVLLDDGAYDALTTNSGIGIGVTFSDFSVSFDWLPETGQPGSQEYHIINPVTFETIYSDYTIPEPGTLSLFVIVGLTLLRRKGKYYESES